MFGRKKVTDKMVELAKEFREESAKAGYECSSITWLGENSGSTKADYLHVQGQTCEQQEASKKPGSFVCDEWTSFEEAESDE